MSNELKTLTIDGIECYEKDGVAYLRLETVARGLGFTRSVRRRSVCIFPLECAARSPESILTTTKSIVSASAICLPRLTFGTGFPSIYKNPNSQRCRLTLPMPKGRGSVKHRPHLRPLDALSSCKCFFDVKVVQKDRCLRVLIGAHVSAAAGGQAEQPHP